MKAEIVAEALALGFSLCRVARCGAPPHGEAFEAWLAEGMAGEMAWLERGKAKRVDPQLVLPGARSVVVLALNYWQGEGKAEGGLELSATGRGARATTRKAEGGAEVDGGRWTVDGGTNTAQGHRPAEVAAADPAKGDSPAPGAMEFQISNLKFQMQPQVAASGRVARYAWGLDYHDLIETKLRALDALMQTFGGRQRYYVDTGPVLERDFAAEAGAGWHGKSTMLLHPQLGTWYFLAELLTTLDLEPDAPIAPRCGSCTRCLDACPTGALRRDRPHQLDARRCISYLTIELKGAIPLEFRPLMGDRIYGCDDCLDACPWNRFAAVSREAAFQARPGTAGMALRDYLALSQEDFSALFKGSPIKRIKRRGLLRNVCVALGNVGTVDDLPALESAAQDSEPLIAEHAKWAIEQIRARMIAFELLAQS